MKSAFFLSASMVARRETSAVILFEKAIKKLKSVSWENECRLEVVKQKHADDCLEWLVSQSGASIRYRTAQSIN